MEMFFVISVFSLKVFLPCLTNKHALPKSTSTGEKKKTGTACYYHWQHYPSWSHCNVNSEGYHKAA